MSKKDIPRLVVRRTPEIESLLQELWHLRPELAEKSKLTILLSLDAFIRESRDAGRRLPATQASAARFRVENVASSDAEWY